MSKHRGAPIRPRWGRIGLLGASLGLTFAAVLGGTGVVPVPGGGMALASNAPRPTASEPSASSSATSGRQRDARPSSASSASSSAASSDPSDDASADAAESSGGPVLDEAGDQAGDQGQSGGGDAGILEALRNPPVPVDSGTGRRAVFDQSQQRVWMVGADGAVERTYLVSGSVTKNLKPGTYEVFSRSEDAVGIDGSTMHWFVRFTRGPSGAAIGFHSLPFKNGHRMQTLGDLGTPQSHGCIRQRGADARAMWTFAPLGTKVVVVA
ncbi:L,D-transpeptidase [Nocardioides acrostichi]|uniref:L,D-transpeptidase n=1 Tax=Nocardioides acrostichi TaxID=2784339 RepID=A0A930YCY2_9ACTN|nr:L,D-transpeptidase [Nocardioides acrostichi]MBF4161904.1 L,D-transpeptidase [Nocardioides acrostichi]